MFKLFSENMLRKFKFRYNLRKITGAVQKDVSTFIIISRQILRKMRNVSDTCCREDQSTHFLCSHFYFSENRAVCEIICEEIKHGTAVRPQMTIEYGACALHAG